jgi:hypothetical protein
VAYYYVEPEVSGGIGCGTAMDSSVHPPVVSRLVYEFVDWLGDGLITSFPCFLVTTDLAKQIEQAGLDGFLFDEVTVTLTPEAKELMDRPLPPWKWLKITGEAFGPISASARTAGWSCPTGLWPCCGRANWPTRTSSLRNGTIARYCNLLCPSRVAGVIPFSRFWRGGTASRYTKPRIA